MDNEHRWTIADFQVALAGLVIADFDILILARLENVDVVILVDVHLAKRRTSEPDVRLTRTMNPVDKSLFLDKPFMETPAVLQKAFVKHTI